MWKLSIRIKDKRSMAYALSLEKCSAARRSAEIRSALYSLKFRKYKRFYVRSEKTCREMQRLCYDSRLRAINKRRFVVTT
jgi:hypothetical protein